MKNYITQGIVLSRQDFGEADRIVKFLTPDHGKITVIAKGARKSKSKLAGAIELFSISDLTILPGKGEIQTLMSARLNEHLELIVKNLERTQTGYQIVKIIDKATEDQPEAAYFDLLRHTLRSLNNLSIEPGTTHFWFELQLLKLSGHAPNLQQDSSGQKLVESKKYDFNIEDMCFQLKDDGGIKAKDIKFLRLGLAATTPHVLERVNQSAQMTELLQPLIHSALLTSLNLNR